MGIRAIIQIPSFQLKDFSTRTDGEGFKKVGWTSIEAFPTVLGISHFLPCESSSPNDLPEVVGAKLRAS